MPDWKQMGFLTPDAQVSQRELWALQGLLRDHLGCALEGLASATAEPTWAATLGQTARDARDLAADLLAEAGDGARLVVADDDLVRELDQSLNEVLASGHVPSLLSTGFSVLGELALVPVLLLDEVAGPHSRLFSARLLASEQHRILGRLAGIVQPSSTERTGLGRMLRHLHGQLAEVHLSWRQTLHSLGVDGERLTEASRAAAASALTQLGLPARRTDLSMFRDA